MSHKTDSLENLANSKRLSAERAAIQDEGSVRRAEPNSRSRNGIVRNTDSFFRDDGVETKKISLTPRLLRIDSEVTNGTGQNQKPTPETFDKLLAADDEPREDKKKKEKKGMLSSIFKRSKDKRVER